MTWAPRHAQRNAVQTAFTITITDAATATAYTSGPIVSPHPRHTLLPEAALRSGGRYSIAVAYRDAARCWSPPSPPALVHVSLLSRDDWTGTAWLGSNATNRYRAEFVLPDARAHPRSSATLYLAGLGYSRVAVNGHSLDGLRMVSAAWTDTSTQVRFAAVDVTDLVTDGPNAVAVELGRGWRDTAVCHMPHRRTVWAPPAFPPPPHTRNRRHWWAWRMQRPCWFMGGMPRAGAPTRPFGMLRSVQDKCFPGDSRATVHNRNHTMNRLDKVAETRHATSIRPGSRVLLRISPIKCTTQ